MFSLAHHAGFGLVSSINHEDFMGNPIQLALENFRTEALALKQAASPAGKSGLPGIKAHFKGIINHLLHEHDSPSEIAWAVFFGVLIGTTPFFGFHLLICLLTALALRLNKIVVYLAANISIPIIAPFLMYGSYQLGFFAFTGHWAAHDLESFTEAGVSNFLYWLVGSFILGSFLGALAATIVFVTLLIRSKRRAKQGTPFFQAALRIHEAFAKEGRFAAGFVKGKSLGDPIYQKLFQELNESQSVLDIGGGQGLACLFLSLKGDRPKAPCWNYDWDQSKLGQGARAAKALGVQNVSFRLADAHVTTDFPRADIVLLIDVLHYNPEVQQQDLIETAVKALNPGGTLIIRDMNADLRVRTFFTTLQERFSLLFKLSKANGIFPRSASKAKLHLENLGMRVKTEPCWKGTPFSNTLIIAKKPAASR